MDKDDNVINQSLEGVISLKSIYNARKAELTALDKVIHTQGGRKRAFQLLPRHLRRRAMSHNPHLVPRRLRDLAIEQSKDTTHPSDKRKFIKKKRPKHRVSKEWFETHLWHAKRFKMMSIWGYKIPYQATLKSNRAIYRELKNSSLIHESSYIQPISIMGEEAHIYDMMESLIGSSIIIQQNLRRVHTVLIKDNEQSIIAPALVHGRKVAEKSCNYIEIWLWVEACGYDLLLSYLTSTFDSNKLTVNGLKGFLNRYEIIGPKSSIILNQLLKPLHPDIESHLSNILNCRPSGVSSGELLTFEVHDPRMTKNSNHYLTLKKDYHSLSLEEKLKFCHVLPNNNNINEWIDHSKIWALNDIELMKCKLSEKDINDGNFDISTSNSTWIMMHRIYGNNNIGEGWAFICLKSWGKPFWKKLSTSGVRVIGLREKNDILFEQSLPKYPYDFPGTKAYNDYSNEQEILKRNEWERKPPAKRVNFEKMNVISPFRPPWYLLYNQQRENESINITFNLNQNEENIKENMLIGIWLTMNTKGTTINENAMVYYNDEIIGFVTSGQFSYSHGKPRALAFCKYEVINKLFKENEKFQLKIRNITSQFYHIVDVDVC